jgi:hypothetical protein
MSSRFALLLVAAFMPGCTVHAYSEPAAAPVYNYAYGAPGDPNAPIACVPYRYTAPAYGAPAPTTIYVPAPVTAPPAATPATEPQYVVGPRVAPHASEPGVRRDRDPSTMHDVNPRLPRAPVATSPGSVVGPPAPAAREPVPMTAGRVVNPFPVATTPGRVAVTPSRVVMPGHVGATPGRVAITPGPTATTPGRIVARPPATAKPVTEPRDPRVVVAAPRAHEPPQRLKPKPVAVHPVVLRPSPTALKVEAPTAQ